ncbi:MAG TPA: hypothetical protein VJQ54_16885, partial [Candidatus Sulfotelmatobacter sp.]|nr:hypothetical protein [Candidatus Sulfotelmatobacter sp.]
GIVYGLEAKDFVVEDNAVVQSVRLDEAPEGQPISLVLVIQTGRRASYEFPRIEGLKTMLDPLFALGASRLAVVEFDSHVQLIRNFSSDESLIDRDLTSLQPGDNGAATLDAVNYSVGLLKSEPDERLRVLLLISETRDHGSRTKIEDSISAIGQSNTLMYALSFSPGMSNILDTARGNNKNEMHEGVNFVDLAYRTAQALRKNVPGSIAQMTGGEYETFTTGKKFDMRMSDFTNHLHSRYLLSFVPKDPQPGLHQLRVKLRDRKDATVLARATYWAQASQ